MHSEAFFFSFSFFYLSWSPVLSNFKVLPHCGSSYCFSTLAFYQHRLTGGIVLASPPPDGAPRLGNVLTAPLPVAGWSRSTPCPLAGRWSTPQRECGILWTTTLAPPPLKTPDPALSQGNYCLSPSNLPQTETESLFNDHNQIYICVQILCFWHSNSALVWPEMLIST